MADPPSYVHTWAQLSPHNQQAHPAVGTESSEQPQETGTDNIRQANALFY